MKSDFKRSQYFLIKFILKLSGPRALEPSQLHTACLISSSKNGRSRALTWDGKRDLNLELIKAGLSVCGSLNCYSKCLWISFLTTHGSSHQEPLMFIPSIEFFFNLSWIIPWKNLLFSSPSTAHFSLDFFFRKISSHFGEGCKLVRTKVLLFSTLLPCR